MLGAAGFAVSRGAVTFRSHPARAPYQRGLIREFRDALPPAQAGDGRAGRNRLLRKSAAETSETRMPTGKISTKVIGSRNAGFMYCALNASMSAASFAISASEAPLARSASIAAAA